MKKAKHTLYVTNLLVLLLFFLPLSESKAYTNDPIITTIFSRDMLQEFYHPPMTSTIVDTQKKVVTVTCNNENFPLLKIRCIPNKWTITLNKFKSISMNGFLNKYTITIPKNKCSILISNNQFINSKADITLIHSTPKATSNPNTNSTNDAHVHNSTNGNNDTNSTYNPTNNNQDTIKNEATKYHLVNKNKYYILNNNSVMFTSTTSKSRRIIIPAYIVIANRKYCVSEISPSALKNNTRIKEVHLPHTLTSIGERAFYRCNNLKKIKCAPLSLKSIKKNAFKGIRSNAIFKLSTKSKKKYKKIIKLITKSTPNTSFKYILVRE